MRRHYVNNLVQYATGIQGITRKATREVRPAALTAAASFTHATHLMS